MIRDIAEDLKNRWQRKWETGLTGQAFAESLTDGMSVHNARPLGLGGATGKITLVQITRLHYMQFAEL
jgi:hypothetical protein